MKIQPPTSEDIPVWLALRQALWPHGPAAEHVEEMVLYGGGDPEMAVFLAFDDEGAGCGFAEACLRSHAEDCTTRPVGYLEGIFVLPEQRGRGIGRALVTAVQDWAVACGCREMASDCLHENVESIEFHKRLGFEVVDTLVHFRRGIV
ncbi:GNAT family N-acetyltransferase [Luteolibacter sp. Populi]|uniref:GNAT family N-acetyltransferase n=1 Tax=Luteolibacter sp. Populi TaxID=3230487 RepID=UPI0034675FD6